MLGAAALSSLAALRSGAGLVTAAVGRDLNSTLQKKISNCVMTMPLAQGRAGAFSLKAYDQLKKIWDRFDAIAIGPGIGRDPGTLQMAREVIIHCPKPLVVDADALYALAGHIDILRKAKAARILTPHSGEMSRLTGHKSICHSRESGNPVHQFFKEIETSRVKTARDFARHYNCVLLLKGHRTVVASMLGETYINRTGNVGMATAGSGDVLTGMITAFLGQGMVPFEAAKYGAYYHGKAGDSAIVTKSKFSLIATDIIDSLSEMIS
jgi:NAD(P)H-hydrate epimerase